MHRLAALLGLLLACPGGAARAQESEEKNVIHGMLHPAFGRLPNVQWKTYVLEVTNPTASEFDATATVAFDAGQVRAIRREKLPAKTTKRLFFYLPNRWSGGRINIDIRDAKGGHLFKASRQEEQDFTRSAGSAPGLIGLALMEKLPAMTSKTTDMSLCREANVPDRAIGFDGFNVVYMRDFGLDRLLPAQRQAILEWVLGGGTLVLYPGANREWLSTRAVQELAPVAISESKEATRFTALERPFGAFRERTPFVLHHLMNGTVLLEGTPPGAVAFQRGAGRVVVVPCDLERAPFDSWPGTEDLRDRLAAAGTSASQLPRLAENTDGLHDIAAETVNTLPPFLLLLGLTILFIVVVGPVNYAVLKRLKMTLLIVVTVPAISAAFLLLIVLFGYVLRGATTVTFDVCVLEASSGDDMARETHLVSIFSPGARTYDISWGGTETGAPWQRTDLSSRHYYYRRAEEDVAVTIDQTDRWTIKETAFTQWQARPFVGHAVRPLDGAVRFSLASDLKVTNGSSYRILHGLLVEGGAGAPWRFMRFPEVPAGESRTFPEQLQARPPDYAAASLDQRILQTWIRERLQGQVGTGRFLVCVLDRLPDEVTINASRSSSSERVCILQLAGDSER